MDPINIPPVMLAYIPAPAGSVMGKNVPLFFGDVSVMSLTLFCRYFVLRECLGGWRRRNTGRVGSHRLTSPHRMAKNGNRPHSPEAIAKLVNGRWVQVPPRGVVYTWKMLSVYFQDISWYIYTWMGF
jgi:hypothetical protein